VTPGLAPPNAITAATASMVVTFVGAEPWGSVPIRKGNDIVRRGYVSGTIQPL